MTQRYGSQRLLLGLLIFLSLFSLGLQLNEMNQIPLDEDYVRAKQTLLKQDYQLGTDALAIIPAWSLRPLQVLGDLEPISSDMIHRLPRLPFKRLFVLQEADAADLFSSLRVTYGEPQQTWELGTLHLHLFTTGMTEKLGTLSQHIKTALVTLQRGDTEQDCLWTRNRHQCPKASDEQHVHGKWMRTTQNASYLIAAKPPKNKGRLKIMFPDQTLKKHLVVFGGHTRSAIKKNVALVSLEILLGDQVLKRVRWGRTFPMQAMSVPVPDASGAQGDLTFIVSSVGNQKNVFGFDAFFSDSPIQEAP